MEELLNNPAVQGGVAPFVVALAAALALFPVRLAGLAIIAALGTAVYLIGGFAFPPASAQQKILLISLAVPVLGIIVDLAFKPTRAAGSVLGLIFGLLVLWVGWNVLKQKDAGAMLAAGAGVAALLARMTAASFALRDDPVRAGAAARGLGLGAESALCWRFRTARAVRHGLARAAPFLLNMISARAAPERRPDAGGGEPGSRRRCAHRRLWYALAARAGRCWAAAAAERRLGVATRAF